ncbi:NADH:flavin oxidoreductase/NADH oxidase [Neisseria iguanae]|uniref:NADPH dehydrogenase n=1 Tax=Neisseria iguanae TaxID=90242 RepID=A0A2P7U0F1_9NEIS|nr:NADH:flavin oxidoreductase/NADH oxidase [Neisseria iguanae]PSJ80421.1 NADPH dehydrogenase [Neisseria iguanae]
MAKFRYLTEPFQVKNLQLKNRVVMPPMCQYVAKDGVANDWHFVHYVSRAVGRVGLIIIEMTNIAPNGRISPNCLGLWNDEQQQALKRIVDACHAQSAKVAVQIGHAGRKALGSDDVVSSSAIIQNESVTSDKTQWTYQTPRALSTEEVEQTVQLFQNSVKRAVEIGFDAIEIHGAHGYLIHQFYSPKMNQRTDKYGQDKCLFGVEVIQAAKAVMPSDMPLFMRISAQEYSDDGFSAEYGVEVAKRFSDAGADVLDVSGGGDGNLNKDFAPTVAAGYQVYLARMVKQATGKPVIAVGMLEDPALADYVLGSGDADLVAIGRGLLRDPYWLLNAQYRQNAKDGKPLEFVPTPYARGF